MQAFQGPGVSGSRSRVQGPGPGSRVHGPGPESGSRVQVQGPGSRVQGPGSGSMVWIQVQGPASRVRVQVLEVAGINSIPAAGACEEFSEASVYFGM